MEVEDEFKLVPSQGAIDRIMAGVSLLTSNSFFKSLPDFNDLCSVLSGAHASPGMFVPADAASCAWGITEAMLLSPPDNDDVGFSEDIKYYVGAVLKDEGILTPPDILNIAHFDVHLAQKVSYDFSDDQEMFSGIFKAEKEKTDDINTFVKTRLTALVHQLTQLPLKNGSVDNVAQKLLATLPQPHSDQPLP